MAPLQTLPGSCSPGVVQSRDLKYRTALQVAEREGRQQLVRLLKSAEVTDDHGGSGGSAATHTGTGRDFSEAPATQGRRGRGSAMANSITRHLGIKR